SRFEIRHLRYLGGTLLLLIFNEIAGNFREEDAEIMPLVDALIALDDFLIDNAVLPSYHVYMVCQKTPNLLAVQTGNLVPLTAGPFEANGPQTLINRPIASITADPNPLVLDSRGFGQTTLAC